MKKLKILRRPVMVLLFLGAFYTTLTSISNVTFTDVRNWMDQNSSKAKVTNLEHKDNLEEKSLKY